ncbi:MAG: FkbM family methyltransferase [Pyrinomonadaceae bacterium]
MNRILSKIRSRVGLKPLVVELRIHGKSLRCREGTIPDTPDYDDAWTFALLQESRIFFDVGCNVGEMSLLSLLDDPTRRIVMMDANPTALAAAAENLLLNNFTFSRSVLAFIGEQDGEEVEFFTIADMQAGSRYRSHAKTASKLGSSFMTSTLTLDTIAEEFKLAPDFIKIDIEGAEAEALNGARRITLKYRPRILVEMHSHDELPMRENGERVLSWCREIEYSAYYLKTHCLVESVDSFANRGRCHLLLMPESEPYPERLREISQGAPVR